MNCRAAVVSGLVLACTGVAVAQLPTSAEHEAIAYSASTPTDAVAHLQQKIDAGEVTLQFDAERGYLPAVLAQLKVPTSSQGLVFSRTSLQLDRITPWTPRAIYFNEDVYVGYVQGGPIVEIAAVDPKLGAVFYTLDQRASAKPTFRRETGTCLVCHDSSSVTGGVPGLIVRSVYTDRYGYTITSLKDTATTDQTPIEDRWGGWYVTGTHGAQKHAGNMMAPMLAHEVGNVRNHLAKVDLHAGGNVTDLKGRFDTDAYLTPHSDIVALLVIAHQSYVHNLITRAGYEARKAEHEGEASASRIRAVAEPLVRALLFVREAPLAAPIAGTSGFAKEFSAQGPRDRSGRSLRELDLDRRLFRYPLSYLIYSESFNALPPVVKQYVYSRLLDVLGGKDAPADFAHLSTADREAIRGILEDTKPDFAALTTEH